LKRCISPSRFGRLALLLASSAISAALVGCNSNQFRLSNRGDTKYERELAARDVRVPVDGGPPVRVPASPMLGQPIVPAVPGQGVETYAATVPAQPAPFPAQLPPRPAETAPGAQPILAETPRPGPVGSRLDMLVGGPELAGRVVTPVGQPSPRTPIQVLDPRQGERVVAEVATDDFGMFRVRNLQPGMPYRLVASSRAADGRLVGSITATPPDAAVVLQLQLENLVSGLSPLGNRLSADAYGASTPAGAASRPIPAAASVAGPSALGNVTVATVRPYDAAGPAMAAAGLAAGAPRVLPPAAGAVGPPSGSAGPPAPAQAELASRPVTNIEWNPPGRSSGDVRVEAPSTEFAGLKDGSKDAPLTLPRDGELALPGPELSRPAAPPKPAATVAFEGTGLEFARVYDLAGNKRPVGALAGDLIVLDFFGSWCGPCRKSIPHLNDLQARFSSRGVRIVGIACEYGDAATALRTANDARVDLGIAYPIVVSPMEEKSELREHFQVDRYPTLVLVDRAGRVLFQGQGGDAAAFQRLEQAIERALSGQNYANR
jgi:thiol-disulfide isomerase/thioredoxin